MIHRCFLLFLNITLLSNLHGQNNSYDSAILDAQKSIEKIIIKSKVPGLAITLSIADNVMWSEGFGYSDLEQQIRIEPTSTKFRIGSISKSFTSVAIGILLEQNRIDLDIPIHNYVPDFPKKKYQITIRQLGGHLAGIRNYKGTEFYNNRKYKNLSEGLNIFKNDSLLFKPNTTFYYSNYGWNLISVAIERVSFTNYVSFMDYNVFQPLKMSSTVPDFNDSIINNRSKFYEKDSLGKIINATYIDNSYKLAAGGYLSTTHDLVKFGCHLLHPQLINEQTVQTLTLNQKTFNGTNTDYGVGWMLGEIGDSIPYYGHSGTAVGGKSILIIIPKYELVFALAANIGNIDFGDDYEIIFEILKQFINL